MSQSIEQKAAEKYPATYEVDNVRYDDVNYLIKRTAYISGYEDAMKVIEEEYSDEALEEFADAVGAEVREAIDESPSPDIERISQERDEALSLLKRASATLISPQWREDYNSLIQKIEANGK